MDTVLAPVVGELQPDLFGGLTPELLPVTMHGYEVYLTTDDLSSDVEFYTIAENKGMAETIAIANHPGYSACHGETERVDDITREMVDNYNRWLHKQMAPMFEMRLAA